MLVQKIKSGGICERFGVEGGYYQKRLEEMQCELNPLFPDKD
jgi:hypothetical protein